MISFRISGIKEFQDYIKALPRGVKITAMRAITEYVIGNPQRGLMRYPRYKYVSRKSAYGRTFVSDKQRRYVMAMIRKGKIDPGAPHRTGIYQRSWQAQEANNDWRRVDVINTASHAEHVGGPNQARLNAKVGWRKALAIVQTNINGAIQDAQRKVDAWIKAKG